MATPKRFSFEDRVNVSDSRGAEPNPDPQPLPVSGLKRSTQDGNAPDSLPGEKPTRPIWADDSVIKPPPPKPTPSVFAKIDASATVPEAPTTPPFGEISARYRGVIGRYQVRELIGQSGLGLVFKAEDIHNHGLVALKVIRPDSSCDQAAWNKFVKDARAAAALQDPRIAAVYEVGEANGGAYLAMELLKGESLETRLLTGSLTLAQSLRVARETAQALAAANAASCVHRDLKPANLWLLKHDILTREGPRARDYRAGISGFDLRNDIRGVKVLDFSLTRIEHDGNGHFSRGTADGTQAYMSPEQAAGELGDARSDLYSLGAILFRLVTGDLPAMCNAPLVNVRPKVRRKLPSALAHLLTQLLRPDPKDRPASAAKVADALARIEADLSLNGQGNRRALMIGGGLLAVLLSLAAWFTARDLLTRSQPDQRVVPAAPTEGPLAPHQATMRVGERVTVSLMVDRVERGPGGVTHIYANDPKLEEHQFRLVVPFAMSRTLLDALKDRGLMHSSTASGQQLRASGMITREGPIAEILIRDPAQLGN